MNTGISTACTYSRCETEDALQILNGLGCKNTEIFFRTFYEYRPEFAKANAPLCGKMNVNSVHVLTNNYEPQLFNVTRRARGDGFYWLDQVLRSAQLFGAKNYTFHGTFRKGNGGVDNFDYLAERLSEILEFCSRYGVQLCLENVYWCLFNRPEVFKQLKMRCQGLTGVFDIKQARLSGYPYQKYINAMAGSISHVHISDVNENGNICLPGKGIYNYTEIFRQLKDAGFDGSIIIEVYPDNYGDYSELKQSLDYLDEIIYKIK